jgi:hypothetical protein
MWWCYMLTAVLSCEYGHPVTQSRHFLRNCALKVISTSAKFKKNSDMYNTQGSVALYPLALSALNSPA